MTEEVKKSSDPIPGETYIEYKKRLDKLEIVPSTLSNENWWAYMRGYANLEGDNPNSPIIQNQ